MNDDFEPSRKIHMVRVNDPARPDQHGGLTSLASEVETGETTWTTRLVMFLRAMAVIAMIMGLYNWAEITGFLGGQDGAFEVQTMQWQAATVYFAVIELVAAVGLFGVMSYTVARRVNEIGVRMALGATRVDVVRMILGESTVLVAAGIAVGIAVALASSCLIAALLFGLRPTDSATIATAVLVLVAVSAVASYLPARRAARVDPMVALRAE